MNINIKLAHCFISSWYYYSFEPPQTEVKSFLDAPEAAGHTYSNSYFCIMGHSQLTETIYLVRQYVRSLR
jgi:hypothetical protein